MVKSVLKKTFFVMAIIVASLFCVGNINQVKAIEIRPSQIEKNIVATDSNPEVSVETNFEMGTVTGAGRYAVGDTVELVATPLAGCYFVKWQVKQGENYVDLVDVGSNVITSPTYTFLMNGDIALKAVFDNTPYTIATNFTSKFTLQEFEFSFDDTRFTTEDLTKYPRADKDNVFVDGKVYYNDIVTLSFVHTGERYVKELGVDNFSSNSKSIAIINISPEGKLISSVINRVTTDYTSDDITLDEAVEQGVIVYDYDNYDYYILTQTKVSDKYTTTNIVLKFKAVKDVNFNLNATELYLLNIKAFDTANNPINISEYLTGLISFDYGYFGALDTESEIHSYLIENRANYSFTFSSNKFYQYMSCDIGGIFTYENVKGYYNPTISVVKVIFNRLKYNVSFEEYVRNSMGRTVLMSTPWYNIPTQAVYPGESVELDAVNKVLTVAGVETDIVTNNIYGYELFAIGDSLNINASQLVPFGLTIDNANPVNLVIYIIHQELDYNVYFDVVDKSANLNSYLKSKISYLSSNLTINVGDTITLTGIAKTGFVILGWKSANKNEEDFTSEEKQAFMEANYLTSTSFSFAPSSNVDRDLYFYLFADYQYYTIDYKLSSNSFDNETAMASLSLSIVEYFTINDSNEFAIYGKEVSSTISDSKILFSATLSAPTMSDRGNGNVVYTYASDLGDFEILKTNGENISLTFASKVYYYDLNNSRFSKDTTVSVDYQVTYTMEGSDYKIKLENVCCDDVVLCLAKNESQADYKFSYFTKDNKSTLQYFKSNNFEGVEKYSYIYSENNDINLTVVFTLKTQTVTVYLKGSSDAYLLGNVACSVLQNGNTLDGKVDRTAESYIVIGAENGQSVVVRIRKNLITAGYTFVNFTTNYSDLNPSGTNLPQYVNGEDADGEYYELSFTMSGEYNGLDIDVYFDEKVYTVKLHNLVEDNGIGLDVRYTDNSTNEPSAVINGEFNIKISNIVHNPFILVSSASGYYVSNAYINEDVADNSLDEWLMGDTSAQTVDAKFVFDDFYKWIFSYANANDEINLYIEQTERTYSITIVYKLEGRDNVIDTKNASINCVYYSFNETKTPVLHGTSYSVIFDKIDYGTSNIQLTMSDYSVPAIVFKGWAKDAVIISSSHMYSITSLTDNVIYYAVFECLEYKLAFKYVYETEEGSKNYVEYPLPVGEVATYNSSFRIGDRIDFTVSTNPGYEFVDLNYGYLIVKDSYETTGVPQYVHYGKNGINYANKPSYTIDLTNNTATAGFNELYCFREDYCYKSKQLQHEIYRTMTIFLVFTEKTYGVVTHIENTSWDNPTGYPVEDWLDIESYSIKYFNGTEYVEKEDGMYSTNSLIEIKFARSFAGINLYNIYLGDSDGSFVLSYSSENNEERELAGQTVKLSKDDELYTLYFQLNTNLLNTVSGDNFEVYLRYEIKTYTINFSARKNNANGDLLTGFDIVLSYSADVLGGEQDDGDMEMVYSNALYGENINWTVGLQSSINNFSSKYYFSHFNVNGKELNKKTVDSAILDSYVIPLKGNNVDIEDIWALCANDKKITIIAYFMPKITFNQQTVQKVEETYVKTVVYNSYEQPFTSSGDADLVGEPDIIYDTVEFKNVTIRYYLNGSLEKPKDAGSYDVSITISGGYTFNNSIKLIINKAVVKLAYNNAILSKEYDGTKDLTEKNKQSLLGIFTLNDVKDNDISLTYFDFSSCYGEYQSQMAGSDINIEIFNIKLSNDLKNNYEFLREITDPEYASADLDIKNTRIFGKITKRQLRLDVGIFSFSDIVYKENQDYVLKYTVNSDKVVSGEKVIQDGKIMLNNRIQRPGGEYDDVYLYFDMISFELLDYSIGYGKIVMLRIGESLAGIDNANYYINDVVYTINIYPYRLTANVEGVGTFEIVDLEEKCLIPISLSPTESLKVTFIDSTNSLYPDLFSVMEGELGNDERIHAFYKFEVYASANNILHLKDFKGCYLRFNVVKNTKKVFQLDEQGYETLNYATNNYKYKIALNADSKDTLSIIESKTYFAIWRIILIGGIILLILILIIILIIILKRRSQKDNEKKEKI